MKEIEQKLGKQETKMKKDLSEACQEVMDRHDKPQRKKEQQSTTASKIGKKKEILLSKVKKT